MDSRFEQAPKKVRPKLTRCILLHLVSLVLVGLGIVHMVVSNNEYRHQKISQTTNIARMGSVFMSADLANDISDGQLNSENYRGVKDELIGFKHNNKDISSIFIYTQIEDELIVLVDSESSGEDLMAHDTQAYRQALAKSEPMMTMEDSSTSRKTVIAPLTDARTGNTIAGLVINYSASSWNTHLYKNAVQAGQEVLLAFILLAVIMKLSNKNRMLVFAGRRLSEKENVLKTLFEHLPMGFALGEDDKLGSIAHNKEFEKIIGGTLNQKTDISIDVLSGDTNTERLTQFREGEISSYTTVKKIDKPDGKTAWINIHMVSLNKSNETAEKSHLCIVEDVTQRILTETALRESERSKAVLLAHLPGMAYRCRYDRNWTMLFVSEGCQKLTGYKPESLLYNNEITYKDLIVPEYREILWFEWKRILSLKIPFNSEYEIIDREGKRKWVIEMGQGIFDEEGNVVALEGLIIDVTENKLREAQIKHMSDHDLLTGLYNRKYFEEEKARMEKNKYHPVSVIIANINGVRLINDAFGYTEGDRVITGVANCIKGCCREGDILARTGGDEFSILLPSTCSNEAYSVIRSISKACELYNSKNFNRRYDVSVSLGFGTKASDSETLEQAAKEAEDYMHNRKLLNRKSSHSTIMASIMTTMYERSQETEEHAERLCLLSKKIGEKLNLTQKSLDELELFAMLHDIGKVGIDDRILNKPGKLDNEEWVIMKRHPEIGYRIAVSSPELEPIAEYILSHHERWDGKGYPQGLKGENIPLLSRILAVADAYDAMTEDRIYRKALAKQDAIEEIRRNAGTQFDPIIAQKFIEIIG